MWNNKQQRMPRYQALRTWLVCLSVVSLCVGFSPAVSAAPAATGAMTVLLSSTGKSGVADAARILARLKALGVDASLIEAKSNAITLNVTVEPEAQTLIKTVTRRGVLGFHRVLASHGPPGEREWKLPKPPKQGKLDLSPIAPQLAQLKKELPTTQQALVNCAQYAGGTHATCRVLVIEKQAALEKPELTKVTVAMEDWGVAVHIGFGPKAASAFAALTREMKGRTLAIIVDGDIVSAPVVQEAITGGQVALTVGGSLSEQRAEAQALATTLHFGALESTWQVASFSTPKP